MVNNIFNNKTKDICSYIFISIILIIIFLISPLSYYKNVALAAKVIVLFLLAYSLYINISQTHQLNRVNNEVSISKNIKSQLNLNLIGSYIFSLFIIILFFFIVKSFF